VLLAHILKSLVTFENLSSRFLFDSKHLEIDARRIDCIDTFDPNAFLQELQSVLLVLWEPFLKVQVNWWTQTIMINTKNIDARARIQLVDFVNLQGP
jgi:hypothetical protein